MEGRTPLIVTHSLVINGSKKTWQLHVHGYRVDTSFMSSLSTFPSNLSNDSVISELLSVVDNLTTCVGNLEPIYVNLGNTKK